MKSYNTKQREILLDYFKNHAGVHVSAREAYAYLKEQGLSIGQSTVYRRIEALVEEGFINKYIIDKNSSACFEYAGEHDMGNICFHCKCDICGKLIHLKCETLINISEHLLNEHSFTLNPKRTVLYGRCEECS